MSNDCDRQGDYAVGSGRAHICRVREVKKVGVEPVRGLRVSSLNDLDVNQAARSLASWHRHLAEPSEAGQRPAQQQPKPVAAPDPTVACTESIMNVLKRVSEIQVTVDYIESNIADRIKSCDGHCRPTDASGEEAGSNHCDTGSASAAANSASAEPRQ